ncbi:MAG TPA: hypothetical protein VF892_26680 [Pseudonocardiaceae bacterium]
MAFRVLGPVEARAGRRSVDVGPPQRRPVRLAGAARMLPVQDCPTV